MSGRYEWPRITAIHPEHGAYEMDVHCVRSVDGAMVLIAYQGTPAREQVELVRNVTEGFNDSTIVDLTADDIGNDIAVRLAATFHAHPETNVVLLQVERLEFGGER